MGEQQGKTCTRITKSGNIVELMYTVLHVHGVSFESLGIWINAAKQT